MSIPTYYLTSVLAIHPAWFAENGYTALLVDMDNTLMPRDIRRVSPEIKVWFDEVVATGIGVALVSNSWHRQCYDVARFLGCEIVAKSIKPLPFAFLAALRKIGKKRKDAIVLGDQLFTDVLGAAFIGVPSIMVEPLVTFDLWHTLIIRYVERWYLGKREPLERL